MFMPSNANSFGAMAGKPHAAEDPVLFPIWSRSEIQRIGIAEADAVPEGEAPQAIDFDGFSGAVPQIISELSSASIKRCNAAVTEVGYQ